METFIRSTGTMSWIDPKTGLPEVDKAGNPGQTSSKGIFLGEKVYRFCNFMEVKVAVENSAIKHADFTKQSGMYRSPSFAGMASAPVGNIGRIINQYSSDSVMFKQVVGCRTVSPEKIGTGAGGGIGLIGGVAAAVFCIGTGGWGALAIGVLGGGAGALTGKELAEYASGFPPIWTEIELIVYADGSITQRLLAHSLFPSVTFYRQDVAMNDKYQQISTYDAVPALDRWKMHGWNNAASTRSGPSSGNPWNMESGNNKLGGHTVHRACPIGYNCT